MIPRSLRVLAIILLGSALTSSQTPSGATDAPYLNWSAQATNEIGRSTYASGRVGTWGAYRGLKTERAADYKLRATWLTPDVIRATARQAQLKSRLSDQETRALVAEAEAAGDTVFIVDIDPDEGSGVIPSDWEAFLQPKGAAPDSNSTIRGTENSSLRKVRALQGVMQRNYDYDRYWVVFPLHRLDGTPLFTEHDTEAQLIVRIYNREGSITWKMPDSIRKRSKEPL